MCCESVQILHWPVASIQTTWQQPDTLVDNGQLPLAEIAAEKAALYEERLKRQSSSDDSHLLHLSDEYMLLRVVLVGKLF